MYRRLLRLHPHHANAHNNLAELLRTTRRDPDGARALYARASALDPARALYHWNRSFLEEARGDVDAAIAEARAFEDKGGAPADAAARLEELGA